MGDLDSVQTDNLPSPASRSAMGGSDKFSLILFGSGGTKILGSTKLMLVILIFRYTHPDTKRQY